MRKEKKLVRNLVDDLDHEVPQETQPPLRRAESDESTKSAFSFKNLLGLDRESCSSSSVSQIKTVTNSVLTAPFSSSSNTNYATQTRRISIANASTMTLNDDSPIKLIQKRNKTSWCLWFSLLFFLLLLPLTMYTQVQPKS